jgi:hypothetical protein
MTLAGDAEDDIRNFSDWLRWSHLRPNTAFLRETAGGEIEVLIGARTYRVPRRKVRGA